jgi:hypothetical protein
MSGLKEDDYIHHHRIILGETLGYLEYLAANGRARVAEGKWQPMVQEKRLIIPKRSQPA